MRIRERFIALLPERFRYRVLSEYTPPGFNNVAHAYTDVMLALLDEQQAQINAMATELIELRRELKEMQAREHAH
jgi:hypothetical protein